MVFNHSVKVPTQYRKAASVLKKAISEKKSVKGLVYEQKHAKISNLLALMSKYSENRDVIEEAIEKTQILVENPRLDSSLARVLITELFFGAGKLTGESAKPVSCVLSYREKLQEAIGSETVSASKSSKASKQQKPRYVRVNTNTLSMEEAFKILAEEEWRRKDCDYENYDGFLKAVRNMEEDEYVIDIHADSLLVFCPKWRSYWASHELVASRKLMLQDKATCVVSELLKPNPDSIVLDMCAAPGMKTIHLSNLMQNKGTIYAVEQDAARYNLLCDMVTDAKAACVQPIKGDVLALTNEDVPGVEYILVDPSCSGSGMQSRISFEKEEKDQARLRKLAGLQIKILSYAMTAFPNAKRVVYSTCSIFEEENEQVVQRCLEKCPNFKLLNGKKCLERKWNNAGSTEYKGVGKNCLYSLPDKDLTDGIFMAVFEKISDE